MAEYGLIWSDEGITTYTAINLNRCLALSQSYDVVEMNHEDFFVNLKRNLSSKIYISSVAPLSTPRNNMCIIIVTIYYVMY